ncbi:SIR2 family protein [Iamia majanohamensis]|uniref:SIR2 family protein n=1 Tax=Iamia majanohamensis TaxID=467976 RepID=A0AAE9Y5N3_9ACTN|nr:SIR2 family protein [Iamia majanohamensis]WCO67250.1 SIR2 family protein [Iamia majanohamensis]
MESLYLTAGDLRFEVTEGSNGRRLRDILGQLIQVNDLCLLVGTGASFHLGAPKIRSVDSQIVKEMCATAGLKLEERHSQLLDQMIPEGTDLEHFLGQLVACRSYAAAFKLTDVTVGEVECTSDELENLFVAVNVGLAWACDLPNADCDPEFESDPLKAHRDLLGRLVAARRPDAPRLKVFTTNYDTVIERTLDESGVTFIDGFLGSIDRQISLASYNRDVYYAPNADKGTVRRVPDLVHLYKLHGSLTWRSRHSSLGSTTVTQSAGPPAGDEVAVIYPTPTKESDVLGHPYSDFLRLFGAAVSEPECALLVIGYGFADEHINRIIFDGMARNGSLQLFIADPFGVVESYDGDQAPPVVERSDSPVGRLSAVKDSRISVLTGEAAIFPRLAEAFPDVTDLPPAGQDRIEDVLAAALLRQADTSAMDVGQ